MADPTNLTEFYKEVSADAPKGAEFQHLVIPSDDPLISTVVTRTATGELMSERIDLSATRQVPLNIKSRSKFADADSLITFGRRHVAEFPNAILTAYAEPAASPSSNTVVMNAEVLFDADHGDAPTRREFTASLVVPLDPRFRRWHSHLGKPLPQRTFSELVEDSAATIVKPSAADMLEVAQTAKGSIGGSFEFTERLANGSTVIAWQKEVSAKAGKSGKLTIPERITCSSPVLRGGPDVTYTMRLRHDVTEQGIAFTLVFDELEILLQAVFEVEVQRVADELGIDLVWGVR